MRRVRIREICRTYAGGTPRRTRPEYYEGTIPWVKSGEVAGVNGKKITATEEMISIRGLENSSAKWIPRGATLVAMYGATAGAVGRLGIEATTNQAVLALVPDHHMVDPDYLYFTVSHNAVRLSQSVQGSGQPNLNATMIRELEVDLPPLPEQRKIAEILRTWDEAIEMESRRQSKYEQLYRGLANALFERNHRVNVVPTKALLKPISRRNQTDLPLLAVTQDSGVVRRDELERRVVMPEGDTSNYKVVRAGDFVVSLRSFEGGLEFSGVTGLVSPAYTVLRVVSDLNPDYYRHFFKSHSFIGRLQRLIFGIRDGKQIAFRDLGDMKIPNPSLEMQAQIAGLLNCIEDAIKSCDQKIEAIKEQKRGLMHKLLTGEWRVNADGTQLNESLVGVS